MHIIFNNIFLLNYFKKKELQLTPKAITIRVDIYIDRENFKD
jgi:hypothetical protein